MMADKGIHIQQITILTRMDNREEILHIIQVIRADNGIQILVINNVQTEPFHPCMLINDQHHDVDEHINQYSPDKKPYIIDIN
jgi:hypothetical protein